MCNFCAARFSVFHRRRKVKFRLAIVSTDTSLFRPFHVSRLAGICQESRQKNVKEIYIKKRDPRAGEISELRKRAENAFMGLSLKKCQSPQGH